eukprot:365945-Chlamydomonas_euryale.AAC.6
MRRATKGRPLERTAHQPPRPWIVDKARRLDRNRRCMLTKGKGAGAWGVIATLRGLIARR